MRSKYRVSAGYDWFRRPSDPQFEWEEQLTVLLFLPVP